MRNPRVHINQKTVKDQDGNILKGYMTWLPKLKKARKVKRNAR